MNQNKSASSPLSVVSSELPYRVPFKERVRVGWQNFLNLPQRLVAGWLRRRGWVVFYLDPRSRNCDAQCCWLKLYEQSEAQERTARCREAAQLEIPL